MKQGGALLLQGQQRLVPGHGGLTLTREAWGCIVALLQQCEARLVQGKCSSGG